MPFSVLALISLLSIHAPFSVHIHLFLLYIIFCLSLNLPSIHLFLLGTIFCPYSSDFYPSHPPLYHFLSSFIHLPFIHLFLFCVIYCQYSSPVPSLPSLYHFFGLSLPLSSVSLLLLCAFYSSFLPCTVSVSALYISLLCIYFFPVPFSVSVFLSLFYLSISVSFLSQLHLISSFSVRFPFSAILSLLSICSFSAPFPSQASSPFCPSLPSLHHFRLRHPLPSVLLFLLCTISVSDILSLLSISSISAPFLSQVSSPFCPSLPSLHHLLSQLPHPPIHLFFLCAVFCYIIFFLFLLPTS